ncbi:MAG TPA: hypothetical protein VGK96_28570 [Candidatus Sulfotelmatobacter sp.]|jgi:hypothetical protein
MIVAYRYFVRGGRGEPWIALVPEEAGKILLAMGILDISTGKADRRLEGVSIAAQQIHTGSAGESFRNAECS